MSKTVFGIFEQSSQAQDARNYLLANGFSSENVDMNTNGNVTGSTTQQNTENGNGDRISNFFRNMFTDEQEVSNHVAAGNNGTIVTVHARTTEDAEMAMQVLDKYGAVDVNEYGNKHKNAALNTETTGAIPIIKEELQVGKREVETGGMRLRSRIVERAVEESIRLREEHVTVAHTKVDRPATDADFANFKEGTIEVTEHAEIPVVAKQAKVVEEVSLGKEVSEKRETIHETVRHTEVDTENIAGTDTVAGSDSMMDSNMKAGKK